MCIFIFTCSTDGSSGSRTQALQKLWLYLISKVSSSIVTWNIVITRLGKPSSAEIKGIVIKLLCILLVIDRLDSCYIQ